MKKLSNSEKGTIKAYYKNNIKYFKKLNYTIPIILLVISVIPIFIDIMLFIFIGMPIIIIGILYIVANMVGTPTDKEYENSCLRYCSKIDVRQDALKHFGLKESDVNEMSPIAFHGYGYQCEHSKCGKDNNWRTNIFVEGQYLFSKEKLYIYHYAFNTTEDRTYLYPNPAKYNYQEIESIEFTYFKTEVHFELFGKHKVKKIDVPCVKLSGFDGGWWLYTPVIDIEEAKQYVEKINQYIKERIES